MAELFNLNNQIYIFRRDGSTTDPYLTISEPLVVNLGRVLLTEIPEKYNRVFVKDSLNVSLFETSSSNVTENQFYVDYNQGIVYFHSSKNGMTLTFDYKGTGMFALGDSRIYTQIENGVVTETLKDLTDSTTIARDDAEASSISANSAAQSANTATTTANTLVADTKFIETYNVATSYKKNNIVSFNGASYMAKRTTVGNTPTDSPSDLNWGILSRKGTDGTGTVHVHKDEFVATEGQRVFTLSYTYDQFQNRTDVKVGGVPQKTPANYEETSSNTITLSEGVSAGTIIEVKYFSESVPLQSDIQTAVDNHTTTISDHATKLNNHDTELASVTSELAEIAINVKSFGAKGDYNPATSTGTDDTAAIQSAIDYIQSNLIPSSNGSSGFTLYFPPGIYLITNSLIIDESILVRGANKASEIRNKSTTGADAIIYSNTKTLFNAGISNLSIVSEASAGHGLNIKYGLATCSFRDLYIFVRNTAKSCIFGDYSVSGIGIYDAIFEGGEYFGERWSRTAPIIDITTRDTLFNENVFRNLRITGATGKQAIHIKNADLDTYLVNNRYENINFEICAGGGLYLESAKANTIANISFWDNPTYTGDLISLGNGAGYASTSNILMNITRHGDALDVGVVDIHFTNSLDSILMGFYPSSSAGGKIDFNSKRATIIGVLNATLLNDTNVVRLSALDGLMTTLVQINGAGKLHQTNGDTILDSVSNGKMIKLETKNASGVTKRIWLEPNGNAFFPVTDNDLTLGKSTYRFKEVFSVVATTDAYKLNPITTTNAPNNSMFIDSADNKLKFKDSAGVVNLLY